MSVAVQPSVGVQCDLGQESQPDVVDQEVQCDLGQESQPRVTSDTWLSINRTWITGSEARRFPVHDYLNSETGDDTVASTLVVHGIPNAVPQREVIEASRSSTAACCFTAPIYVRYMPGTRAQTTIPLTPKPKNRRARSPGPTSSAAPAPLSTGRHLIPIQPRSSSLVGIHRKSWHSRVAQPCGTAV